MRIKKLILLVAIGLSFSAIGEATQGSESIGNKDSIETKVVFPSPTTGSASEQKISLQKQKKVIRPTTTWSKIKDLFM